MIPVSGGFALMAMVFIVLAVVFAVASAETRWNRRGAIYARIGFVALGVAVASALAAIWLAVAGL